VSGQRRRGAIALLVPCLALLIGALAHAETVQKGSTIVHFEGELTPRTLPRKGLASVRALVGMKVSGAKGENPAQLRQIQIAINRNGKFDYQGLPTCSLSEVQPSTTSAALAACRDSLVGEGSFSAKVLLSHQSPFPSAGKVYAFNSLVEGHPAILAHVYGPKPVPTSFTLVFELHQAKGTFGTLLSASLPEATGRSAYITGLSLNLFRRFSYRGTKRSYISAGCPAPKGFSKVSFPFAQAKLGFTGGQKIAETLVRECKARG
jgi:hypothetical protein